MPWGPDTQQASFTHGFQLRDAVRDTVRGLVRSEAPVLGPGEPGALRSDFSTDPTCAVDETVILLRPPLPLVGVSMQMERGCQHNDSLADG